MSMMCGGPSETKDATDEIQAMVEKLRPKIEAKAGVNGADLKAVSYKSQVVAGTNYFIKVLLGGDNYAHLRVFQPLPHAGQEADLTSVQLDKKLNDAIEYF